MFHSLSKVMFYFSLQVSRSASRQGQLPSHWPAALWPDLHWLSRPAADEAAHGALAQKTQVSEVCACVYLCVFVSLCVCVCVSAAEFCFYTWKVSNYSISPPDSKPLCFFPSSSSSCQTSHTAPCGGIHSVAVVFLLALSAFSFFIIFFFFTMRISCIVLELSTAGHCLPRPGLHIYARKIYFDISLSVWGHLSDCLSPGFRAADVTAASDFTWTTAATESRARLRSRTQSLWSILDRYRASSN